MQKKAQHQNALAEMLLILSVAVVMLIFNWYIMKHLYCTRNNFSMIQHQCLQNIMIHPQTKININRESCCKCISGVFGTWDKNWQGLVLGKKLRTTL